MSKTWPKVRLGDVLKPTARPVDVKPDELYREIGIRSHGKGVFHKTPISGLELGNKRVFWIQPGDFVLNIVFAWEGAVALLSEAEAEMIGSHRFPTFRADEARLDSRYLLAYFKTHEGRGVLGTVSPGGAGRNRTLSKTALLQHEFSLPPLAQQMRVVAQIEGLSGKIREVQTLRQEGYEAARLMTGAWLRRILGTVDEPMWSLSPLQSVCSVFIDCDHKTPDYVEHGIPLLRPRDIKPENFTVAGTVRISEEEHEKRCLRHRPIEDDIVYSRELSFGNAAMIPKNWEVSLGQGTMLVRADDRRVQPLFLLKVLNAPIIKEQAIKAAKGAAHPHVNLKDIRQFGFPVPTISEQDRILAELEVLEIQVGELKRLQSETAVELDAMLPALLDRAFTQQL